MLVAKVQEREIGMKPAQLVPMTVTYIIERAKDGKYFKGGISWTYSPEAAVRFATKEAAEATMVAEGIQGSVISVEFN